MTKLSVVDLINQSLLPAHTIAASIGPVGHHELAAVVTAFRNALVAVATYDPDTAPDVIEPAVSEPAGPTELPPVQSVSAGADSPVEPVVQPEPSPLDAAVDP